MCEIIKKNVINKKDFTMTSSKPVNQLISCEYLDLAMPFGLCVVSSPFQFQQFKKIYLALKIGKLQQITT